MALKESSACQASHGSLYRVGGMATHRSMTRRTKSTQDGLQITLAVYISLTPAGNRHALEQTGKRKRVVHDETLGFLARVEIDNIQATTRVAAVVLEFRAARKQQRLDGFEIRQMHVALPGAHRRVTGFIPRFDDERHRASGYRDQFCAIADGCWASGVTWIAM